jgi:hypothetical protein
VLARRAAIAFGLLLLALSLSACSDQEEAKRQQLVQAQIGTVQRQVAEIKDGHDKLQAGLNRMRELVRSTDNELARSDARVYGINATIPYLRQLTQSGFGETPSSWIIRNPDLGPGVLVPTLLFLLVLWIMWRIRQGQLQHRMSAEIDRVIQRLSAEPRNPAQPGASQDRTGAPMAPRRTAAPQARAADEEARPEGPAAQQRGPAPQKTAPSAGAQRKTAGPRKTAAAKASGPKRKAGPDQKAAATPAGPGPSFRRAAKQQGGRQSAAKKCKVKGCNNKHRSKGYCNKHYQQWRKGVLREEVEE